MAQLLRIAVLEASGEPGPHATVLLENCATLAGDLKTEFVKTIIFLYGKPTAHLPSNLRLRVTSFTHSAVPIYFQANYAPGTFDARAIVRLLTIIAYREAFREGSDVPEALRQNTWVLRFLRPLFDMKMKSKSTTKDKKTTRLDAK